MPSASQNSASLRPSTEGSRVALSTTSPTFTGTGSLSAEYLGSLLPQHNLSAPDTAAVEKLAALKLPIDILFQAAKDAVLAKHHEVERQLIASKTAGNSEASARQEAIIEFSNAASALLLAQSYGVQPEAVFEIANQIAQKSAAQNSVIDKLVARRQELGLPDKTSEKSTRTEARQNEAVLVFLLDLHDEAQMAIRRSSMLSRSLHIHSDVEFGQYRFSMLQPIWSIMELRSISIFSPVIETCKSPSVIKAIQAIRDEGFEPYFYREACNMYVTGRLPNAS